MKITTELTHHVDYVEFDRAVSEFYGIDYEYVADEEMSNDSAQVYHVDGKLDDWELNEIKTRLVLGGDYMYMANTILNHMAGPAGVIPVGNYVIHVSW